MQCLWLTLADPEPATNGQLIYSKGLIEAACRAGASLTVIGLARPENPRPSAEARTIDWRLADERRKSARRRLLARDPTAAQRGSPQMQCILERALAERSWDAVVFERICADGRCLTACAIAWEARGRRASSTSRTITRSPWRAASPPLHRACVGL